MKILVLGDKQLITSIAREGYKVTSDPGDDIICAVSDTTSFRMAPVEIPLVILLSNSISDWAARQERPKAVFQKSVNDIIEYLAQITVVGDIPKIKTQSNVFALTHSNKGGSGKSSAAISLAVTLSNMDMPTVICDFDFIAPDIATFFNIRKHTARYLEGNISEVSVMSAIVKVSDNLYALPWPDIPDIPDIQAQNLLSTINILKKRFPVIIGDTMPASREKSFIYPLFENADLVYSVVEPSKFSMTEAEVYAPLLLMMGVKPHNIRIIINKYNPKLASIKEIEKIFHTGFKKDTKELPRLAAVIPDCFEEVEKALKHGQISNHLEWAKACHEIVQMLEQGCMAPVDKPKGGLLKWLKKPWPTASAKWPNI